MVLFPSIRDGLAKTISTKKGKIWKKGEEEGKEAVKMLAKEAKKNEMLLTSSGCVKSIKTTNCASLWSKRGEKGINQDCFLVWEEFGCEEDMIVCGVYDGHGPWGHLVSKRVRKSVPSSLLLNWKETIASTSPALDFGTQQDDIYWFNTLKQSFLKAYAAIDLELKHHPRIDSSFSGTTALTLVRQGDRVVIANVGDSRAVLATVSDDGSSLVPIQLTVDFKPNLPEEAKRIRESKGRVFCMQDEPGMYRLWMPNGDSPGLALSRALGDYCVKDFGLISVPDVTVRKMSCRDQFVILATDGVWDVISNKEAVEIVSLTVDREKAAKRLVECAANAWKRKRRGIAMDDISAICLFFH